MDRAGGDVFLLLARVMLEGRVSNGCLDIRGLDLVAANLLVEQVLDKRGVLLRTMLAIGGKPPS